MWVRRSSEPVCDSICEFVCLSAWLKNEWSQSVQTWYRKWPLDSLQMVWFWGQKVTGSQSATHIECSAKMSCTTITKLYTGIVHRESSPIKVKGQARSAKNISYAIEWPVWVMHSVECPLTSLGLSSSVWYKGVWEVCSNLLVGMQSGSS